MSTLFIQFPSIAQIPFPAKKTFHNTQRSVLEHRMTMLNEFMKTVSMRADDNDELYAILREFLEPDTDDKKIHGGTVIRTVFMTFRTHLHNFRAKTLWTVAVAVIENEWIESNGFMT